MEKYAIIVAGGKGTRMGAEIPKQFLKIHDCPILVYTIQAFLAADRGTHIILVLPKDQIDRWEAIAKVYQLDHVAVATGGATRFHSVKSGLNLVKHADAVVAVHDAVRPCINSNTILEAYQTAINKQTAVVCVPSKDSLRRKSGDRTSAVNRADYLLVQTPQVFESTLLKKAYEQEYAANFTDDASVVESTGAIINVVACDYRNIKITTEEDLIIASAYLK